MSQAIHYDAVIYWSEIDGHYLAEVPDLPGCMADGRTLREAAANVEIVVNDWIESALLDGEPVPKPKNKVRQILRKVS